MRGQRRGERWRLPHRLTQSAAGVPPLAIGYSDHTTERGLCTGLNIGGTGEEDGVLSGLECFISRGANWSALPRNGT